MPLGLFICVAFRGLNVQRPKGQTRWDCHLALIALEMLPVFPVNILPRELFAENHLLAAFPQCDPKGYLQLQLVIIFVPIHLFHLQVFFLEYEESSCRYYTIFPSFFPVFSTIFELF